VTLGADRQWFLPYYLDVGAGESDLTWQGMAGLGYSFDSIDVVGVWRYLDYDLGDSTPIKSIDFNGAASVSLSGSSAGADVLRTLQVVRRPRGMLRPVTRLLAWLRP